MPVFHVSQVQEGAVPLSGVHLQELRRGLERAECSLCLASDVGYGGDEAAVEQAVRVSDCFWSSGQKRSSQFLGILIPLISILSFDLYLILDASCLFLSRNNKWSNKQANKQANKQTLLAVVINE